MTYNLGFIKEIRKASCPVKWESRSSRPPPLSGPRSLPLQLDPPRQLQGSKYAESGLPASPLTSPSSPQKSAYQQQQIVSPAAMHSTAGGVLSLVLGLLNPCWVQGCTMQEAPDYQLKGSCSRVRCQGLLPMVGEVVVPHWVANTCLKLGSPPVNKVLPHLLGALGIYRAA